jgi:hypothetical protein
MRLVGYLKIFLVLFQSHSDDSKLQPHSPERSTPNLPKMVRFRFRHPAFLLNEQMFILTFVPCICIVCTMNRQMHNRSTIYYSALYYTAPTCFDAIASSSGSSQSVPAKLHKYLNAVLVTHYKTLHVLCC